VKLPRQLTPGGVAVPGIATSTNRAVRRWSQMSLSQHATALRTYRFSIILLVLLSGAGAALATALQTPVYRASTQLFFAPNFESVDIRRLNEGGNYILQRVRSYAQVADSPEIAAAVIERLDLPYGPERLTDNVTVSGRASTAVLDIEVRDSSATRARDIANAIADEFPAFIDRLERPTGLDRSPVKVSVVRRATTPSGPESPRPLLGIGLGLVCGLAIGAVAAVARYAMDETLADGNQAAEFADTVLVGVVADRVAQRVPAIAQRQTEDLRQLRTNLLLRAAGKNVASVAVTGSVAGDGTTAVAADLATAFARAGQTVVLIDADLRNPGLSPMRAGPGSIGLANVLRREASVSDAMRQWQPDLPLYLLPAGSAAEGSIEQLLRQPELAALMESFRQDGVFVVIDVPPLLTDAEAIRVICTADATVLVHRLKSTPADKLATAAQVMRAARVNLLGLVAVQGPAGPVHTHRGVYSRAGDR